MTKKKSGRLNSIELLPTEADDIIENARQAVLARRKTRTDIYIDFHTALSDKGIVPPSKTAFDRWADTARETLGTPPPATLINQARSLVEALRTLADDLEAAAAGKQ